MMHVNNILCRVCHRVAVPVQQNTGYAGVCLRCTRRIIASDMNGFTAAITPTLVSQRVQLTEEVYEDGTRTANYNLIDRNTLIRQLGSSSVFDEIFIHYGGQSYGMQLHPDRVGIDLSSTNIVMQGGRWRMIGIPEGGGVLKLHQFATKSALGQMHGGTDDTANFVEELKYYHPDISFISDNALRRFFIQLDG